VTSSTNAEFCDTNVLAYAFGPSRDPRHPVAERLVRDLALADGGAASEQVLQELYVVLTRKLRPPRSASEARAVIDGLVNNWTIFAPDSGDVLDAIDNSTRWQVSFWDAMLLTAANKLGAGVLWSEDLNDGQTYGQTTVRNPFA
jgi:predicted nucleic acid-binding protein